MELELIEYGKDIELPIFVGEEHDFCVAGKQIHISADIDKFNTYRKMYRKIARQATDSLAKSYRGIVVNLDKFLIEFPKMYVFYREPLLEAAVNNLIASGVYDVSLESFAADHTADFCLCGEDLTNIQNACDLTIQNNQRRKINTFNMLPGFIFSGPLGLAAATATNVGLSAIESASVRNAKLSAAQRTEIFNRVKTGMLMERAFLDYWRVFCSLTYKLYVGGKNNWYPTVENNNSVNNLLNNLCSGKLPESCYPDIFQQIADKNIYMNSFLEFLEKYCPGDEGLKELSDYLEI